MKNDYCKLSREEIHALPNRFKGFLLSPFQFNLRNGMVAVPEDTFQEMIDIIAEYAEQIAAAGQGGEDARLLDFVDEHRLEVIPTCEHEGTPEGFEVCEIIGPREDDSLRCLGFGQTIREAIDAAIAAKGSQEP